MHSALDLRMNARRTFDQHRIERLGCAEIRLEMQRDARFPRGIPDTLLHEAGHIAGIHIEMLTPDSGGCDLRCDLIGDAIDRPADRIGNHLNRFGEADTPLVIRLVRAGMLDVMREDYVRTARAKGIAEHAVILRHVFRNALIGVVATLGFTFVGLVSEAVVTETVFALPGIGRLVVQSILRRDYPVIQGIILVIIVFYIVVNLVVDIVTTWLDPRVKLQ